MEEYVYTTLSALYDEWVADFPDEYIHLGMDEAYHACWFVTFIYKYPT